MLITRWNNDRSILFDTGINKYETERERERERERDDCVRVESRRKESEDMRELIQFNSTMWMDSKSFHNRSGGTPDQQGKTRSFHTSCFASSVLSFPGMARNLDHTYAPSFCFDPLWICFWHNPLFPPDRAHSLTLATVRLLLYFIVVVVSPVSCRRRSTNKTTLILFRRSFAASNSEILMDSPPGDRYCTDLGLLWLLRLLPYSWHTSPLKK